MAADSEIRAALLSLGEFFPSIEPDKLTNPFPKSDARHNTWKSELQSWGEKCSDLKSNQLASFPAKNASIRDYSRWALGCLIERFIFAAALHSSLVFNDDGADAYCDSVDTMVDLSEMKGRELLAWMPPSFLSDLQLLIRTQREQWKRYVRQNLSKLSPDSPRQPDPN